MMNILMIGIGMVIGMVYTSARLGIRVAKYLTEEERKEFLALLKTIKERKKFY